MLSFLRTRWWLAILLAVTALFGVTLLPSAALDIASTGADLGRHDLWRLVNFVCVPASKVGIPFPCSSVEAPVGTAPGFAILPVATGHILTVPTEPIAGIESPEVLTAASARYWQAAWDARSLLDRDFGRKLDRTDIALAINSPYARSQDQFHIHTACVDPAVKAAIEAERDRIGPQWTRLRALLNGSHYSVRSLDRDSLRDTNVLDLLPDAIKRSPEMMARQAVVVVGANFGDRPGFYLLNDRASQSGAGHGEALLDFRCRGGIGK